VATSRSYLKQVEAKLLSVAGSAMPDGGEIRCSAGLGRDWERDKPDRGRFFARIEKALRRHGQTLRYRPCGQGQQQGMRFLALAGHW